MQTMIRKPFGYQIPASAAGGMKVRDSRKLNGPFHTDSQNAPDPEIEFFMIQWHCVGYRAPPHDTTASALPTQRIAGSVRILKP
jgi:hypothetical protein